jgi:hypothetical protein
VRRSRHLPLKPDGARLAAPPRDDHDLPLTLPLGEGEIDEPQGEEVVLVTAVASMPHS